jgi:NDP-sugar pyrophosphorylase family protein
MKTLLFATRDGPELDPLTRDRCVALLPLAGKPLILHTIESLAMAAVAEIIIVTRPAQQAEVEKEIGNGARWGMRFEYIRAGFSDSSEDVVRQLADHLDDELLMVRADVLRTPIVSEFLSQARMSQGRSVTATIRDVAAGLTFVSRGELTPSAVSEFLSSPGSRVDVPALEFPMARLSRIESLAAFHRANIDAVSGGFPGLVLAGRPLVPGVTIGRKTSVAVRSLTGRPVFVGSRCRISASAELKDDVVISDDVVIDRRVTLKSAVIMPNTYIGEFLEVSDAIVQGNTLIHIDDAGATHVSDPLLLRSMISGVLGRSEVSAPIDRVSTANNGSAMPSHRWPLPVVQGIARGIASALGQLRSSKNLSRSDDPAQLDSRSFGFKLSAVRWLADLFAMSEGRQGLSTHSDLEVIEAEINVSTATVVREDADLTGKEPRELRGPKIRAGSAGDEPKRTETFVTSTTREEFRRGEAVAIFRNGKGATQSGKGSNTREAV